ncbi:MAG: alanine/glycine:cation symporter family protein, partial [Gemmiger sp.]
MYELIVSVNNAVNGFVWGPAGLALLFVAGLIMTCRTKGFQFTHFGYWMKKTIGAIFTNRRVTAHTGSEDKSISQFQSLCTALAATIGTGNIVGVATAIVNGGPGAIFWMWIMALLGMMTNYSENVLGIFYRRKNEKGEWSGGAMYYLRDGLGSKKGCAGIGKVLAVLFSVFCVLASFGIGNMSQVNSIAGNMNAAFGVPNAVCGILLAVLSALVIVGGLKRVAAVTEKIVPVMAVLYIVGAVAVVLSNITQVPAAFAAIFRWAFDLRAIGGGILGYVVKNAITWGFKRGAFSNEAGLGSSVMVHSSSNVREPVQQGMWGIFEVFADTIVVCTLTALVILTSGLVDLNTGAMLTGSEKSTLVAEAFSQTFGGAGSAFIAIAILLFAFSTVLGWSYYGTRAWEYLFGTK